ncbi:GFA family protein [Pseudomonas syringae]|uniref:GFA family protein n=1 Tax=Pseudomonas syringae TaxID=317 RepID=UPI003F754BC5
MIKQVGSTEIKPVHQASCHCGAIMLELELPDGIVDPRRCDCSLCRRRGAIVASVAKNGVRVVHGQSVLKLYQFNTRTAEHYFCGRCGVYTHHQRRSNPDEYGYNVACLEGVNPFDLGQVKVSDGVNHPSDRPAVEASESD